MASSQSPSLSLFESQINQANILQQKSQLVAFYLRNYILQQAVQFLKSERSQGKDVTNLVKEVQTWFQNLEVIKESLAYQLQNEEMCQKQYYDFTCYQFSRCKTLYDNDVQSQQLLSDLGSVILLAEAYSVFGSPNADVDNIKNFSKTAHQRVTQALQAKAAQEKPAPTYSRFGRPDQSPQYQGGYSPRGPSQPSQPVQPAQPTQTVNYEELARQNGYNLCTPNPDEQNSRFRSPSPSQGRSFFAPSRQNQQSYYEELARKQGHNLNMPNPDEQQHVDNYMPIQNTHSQNHGIQGKNYEELARQNGYNLYTPNPDDEGMNNQGFSVKNKSHVNQDKIQYDNKDNKVSQNTKPQNYEELARQNGYDLSTPNPDDQIAHHQEPQSNQGYNPYESPNHQSRQIPPYEQQNQFFGNMMGPNNNNAFSGFQGAESLIVPQSKIDQQRKNSVQPQPPARNAGVSVFGRGPSEPQQQYQQQYQQQHQQQYQQQHQQSYMSNQGQNFQAPPVNNTSASNPLHEFAMTESGFVSQELLDQVKSQVNRSKIGTTSMHDAMQGGYSQNLYNQYGNQGNTGPSGHSLSQGLGPKVPDVFNKPIESFSDFQASESIVMPQASFGQQKIVEQQPQPVSPVEIQPVHREDVSPKQHLESFENNPKNEEVHASPEPSQKQTENLDNLQSQQSDEIRAQSNTENNNIPPFPGFELIESSYVSKIPTGNAQAQNTQVPLLVSNNPAAQPLSWLQMADSFYIPRTTNPQDHQSGTIIPGSLAHIQPAPQNIQAQDQNQNQQQTQTSTQEAEAQKPFSGFQGVDSVFVPQEAFHKQQSLGNGDANHMNMNQAATGNSPTFHLQVPTQEFQGLDSRQLNSPNFGFSHDYQFQQSQGSNNGMPDFARFGESKNNMSPTMQHQGSLNQNYENQYSGFGFQQNNMMGQGMNYFVPAPNQMQQNNDMGFSIQLTPNFQAVNPSPNMPYSYLDLMNASRPGAANIVTISSQVEPKIEPKNEPKIEEIPKSPVIQENIRDVPPQEIKRTASNSASPSRFGRSKIDVNINVPDKEYITLRELCRMTISELDFSNAKEAKENIRKALSLINQYSSPA